MLIPGTESLLCVAVLLFGSVGLFAMFLLTDADARRESELPQHATEKRDETPTRP